MLTIMERTSKYETLLHYKGDKVHTVYRNGEELYYNWKVLYNRYEKVHVSVEEVVTLHRGYCKAKSFPLKRIVMTINPIDGPIIPYVAVLYQIDSPITEDKRTLCHGNSKENESRPYIRTSKMVLSKTKDFLKISIILNLCILKKKQNSVISWDHQ